MGFISIASDVKRRKVTDEPKFGTVVFNDDPLQLGRVKVEIKGIFEGEPATLPWVRRKTDTLFCGTDCECFDVPEIGSVVEVRWCYDDDTPIYMGAPYSERHKTGEFTNNYPHEAGFKFGLNTIKFDKASQLLTIGNSKVTIMLDVLGECTIVANDLTFNVKNNLNIKAANVNIGGDLSVDGSISATKGADGTITPVSPAIVCGGIIQSIKGP